MSDLPPSTSPDEPTRDHEPHRPGPGRPGATPPPYAPQPQYGQPGQYGQRPQYGQPGQYDPQPQYVPAGQYGQPGPYGQQVPTGPAAPAGGPIGLQITLGERARRRPEARAAVSFAAGGAALLLLGVLVWAGGYYGAGINVDFNSDSGAAVTSGDSRRFLGAGLFLAVAISGYALMVIRRNGPLATAGAVAAGFGVPLAIGFVSLSVRDLFSGSMPINLDAVYLVSIVVWLVSYLLVPGARGRAFFLGLAALGLSSYVGFKVAGDDLLRTSADLTANGAGGLGSTGSGGFAVVGITFGLVYYAAAAALDRRGRDGAAVALVVAGFFATAGGIVGGAASFGLVGTGITLLLIGAALTLYGGYFARRFTSWVWAAGFLIGIGLLVAKVSPDSYTAAGITFIVLGALVTGGAAVLSKTFNERPDIVESVPGR